LVRGTNSSDQTLPVASLPEELVVEGLQPYDQTSPTKLVVGGFYPP